MIQGFGDYGLGFRSRVSDSQSAVVFWGSGCKVAGSRDFRLHSLGFRFGIFGFRDGDWYESTSISNSSQQSPLPEDPSCRPNASCESY